MSILLRVVLGILSIGGIYMSIGFINNLIYDIKYTKDNKVVKFNTIVGTIIMVIVTLLLIWVTIFGPMPWML